MYKEHNEVLVSQVESTLPSDSTEILTETDLNKCLGTNAEACEHI